MSLNEHKLAETLGQRRPRRPIAVYFGDAADAGFPIQPVADRVLSLARERDWQLINLSKFDGRLPESLKVDGAIVSLIPTQPEAAELLEAGIPTVRVGRMSHPQDDQMPAVVNDRAACGRLAAEHFAERRFKHLACVIRRDAGDSAPMFDAFVTRGEELGCASQVLRLNQEMLLSHRADGRERIAYERQVFDSWLKQLSLPVGLLTITDVVADRYAHWVTEAGLRVPEDVAVLGVGNRKFNCESSAVPISSIARDADRIAEYAVDLLEQIMAGRKPEQTTVELPPRGVVCRASTDVLAASDPNVVKALRFMWDNVDQSLSVDQIVEHVGIPRRTLEAAFSRQLDRGIAQEFQRRRLEKAKELLEQTDMRACSIAEALNFGSNKHFGYAFRQAYDISPGRYRTRYRKDMAKPA